MMIDDDELLGAGPAIKRIAEVTALDGRTVMLTWTTGEQARVELTPLIAAHEFYSRLRDDDAYFRTVKVSDRGNELYWLGENQCAIPASYLEEFAVTA